MVLRVVVSFVFATGSPVDEELALADAILDPVETHVHSFGAFLLDRFGGKADGGCVVGL
jgi:hypothetical protein